MNSINKVFERLENGRIVNTENGRVVHIHILDWYHLQSEIQEIHESLEAGIEESKLIDKENNQLKQQLKNFNCVECCEYVNDLKQQLKEQKKKIEDIKIDDKLIELSKKIRNNYDGNINEVIASAIWETKKLILKSLIESENEDGSCKALSVARGSSHEDRKNQDIDSRVSPRRSDTTSSENSRGEKKDDK